MTPDPDNATPTTTTNDAFLGGALTIRQPRHGYRAGLDAVLLGAACPASPGNAESCLDCGSGVGVASLVAAHRVSDLAVTMIERDAETAAIARANVAINRLGERVRVVVGDLTAPLSSLGTLSQQAGTFDHVIANPPFFASDAGTRPTDKSRADAHVMAEEELENWIRFAAAMARADGTLTLIHRTAALRAVLAALDRRFGAVRIAPIHAREAAPASRILVQAIKGSRAELRILPGRVLHAADSHAFTPEFDAILRHGTAFDWRDPTGVR